MKLSEIRVAYEHLSGTLSNVCRSLVFAGIGIVWIFVKMKNSCIELPESFIYPLQFFIWACIADLLQYVYQTTVWALYYWYHKSIKNKAEKTEMNESEWWNLIAWLLMFGKVILMGIGYFKLSCALFHV